MNKPDSTHPANPVRRRLIQMASAAFAAPGLHQLSWAQPGSKIARMIVGFPAGGNGDTLARALAEDLKDIYPAGLIVENKAGASGRLAVDAVRTAEPDGNTLIYSPASIFTILPHALKAGAFRPLETLTPIGAVSRQDFAIAVSPTSGIKSVQELVVAARKDPKFGTFGTAGAGTPQHLIGYLLGSAAKVTMTHVAYRGGSAALQDTIGGHLPVCIAAVSEQLSSFGADGRLRIIAVAGSKRSKLLPQVPTLQEQGFNSIVVEDWSGVLAPLNLPPAIVEQISRRLMQVTSTAAYAETLLKAGQEPLSVAPAAYMAHLKQEQARWGPIVKAAGFTLDS